MILGDWRIFRFGCRSVVVIDQLKDIDGFDSSEGRLLEVNQFHRLQLIPNLIYKYSVDDYMRLYAKYWPL